MFLLSVLISLLCFALGVSFVSCFVLMRSNYLFVVFCTCFPFGSGFHGSISSADSHRGLVVVDLNVPNPPSVVAGSHFFSESTHSFWFQHRASQFIWASFHRRAHDNHDPLLHGACFGAPFTRETSDLGVFPMFETATKVQGPCLFVWTIGGLDW